MRVAIAESSRFVHLMFYIWQDDRTGREFRDLLIQKAAEGVSVRVLYDAIGSRLKPQFMAPLIAAGAKVAIFMPPRFWRRSLELNFRNHRKIVVADGRLGIIGGLNIGDEYRHQWRDTAVKLTGPVVDQLEEVFQDDWHFATGEEYFHPRYFKAWQQRQFPVTDPAICGIVASGPHTRVNLSHETIVMAIHRANLRVWIATPYFIPDQTMLSALRTAAYRGVDVRVVMPEKSDFWPTTLASRSYHPDLLHGGVRLFEYEAGFMHSKASLFDDSLAIVGSANMDIRSFRLNFEINCLLRSPRLNAELAELLAEYMRGSRELSLDEVESRPYWQRVSESAAHLFSPLL